MTQQGTTSRYAKGNTVMGLISSPFSIRYLLLFMWARGCWTTCASHLSHSVIRLSLYSKETSMLLQIRLPLTAASALPPNSKMLVSQVTLCATEGAGSEVGLIIHKGIWYWTHGARVRGEVSLRGQLGRIILPKTFFSSRKQVEDQPNFSFLNLIKTYLKLLHAIKGFIFHFFLHL